jgi:hypothetical protein
LIDSSDKEQLLLRNPADYRSGFWVSYLLNGEILVAGSTEDPNVFPNPQKEIRKKGLNIAFNHVPRKIKQPVLNFSIDVWSFNEPFMLFRHTTSNMTTSQVQDVRLYFFMDFDIGGPRSYKDDYGLYNPEKSLMTLWDENSIYVDLNANPKADSWEISPPAKLKVSANNRDLKMNQSLGPKDVASALQWNLGDLNVSASKSIDIVLTAALSSQDAESLLPKAWELFDKKIR